jgi:hypothetical protein
MVVASLLKRFQSFRGYSRNCTSSHPAQAARGIEPLEDRVLMSTYSVSNLLDHGPGSLRQAVLNANARGGADAITFAASVHGSITLTSGQLSITGSLSVTGPGASALTVSGHNTSRVFQITGSSTIVLISKLTIANGNAGAAAGGGLLNYGKLTLSSAVVSNNVSASNSTGASTGVGGAGLMNFGTATISDTTFKSNHVYAHDNTFRDGGGAIYNAGNLNVTRSLFASNTGQLSPSVHPGANPASYGANGGAIFNAGTMKLTNSTVYGNHADVLGGGIYIGVNGKATLVNCTVSANVGAYTGGICVFEAQDLPNNATLTLGNTIVAANSDTHGDSGRSDVANNHILNSLGHNLIGIDNGSANWTASDLLGTEAAPLDPHLSTLSSHGGPTQTAAITASGPAYNAGANSLASTYGLTTDQRGQPRIGHGIVDIGAFEL